MKLDIFTDGACSGNPGPAGIGVVIKCDGKVIKEISQPIGNGTNNIAEYTALIYALKEALVMKAVQVDVMSDSELMCMQVAGVYKVKHANIKPLFTEVKNLSMSFKQFRLMHIPRDKNAQADRLSRQAVVKAGQGGRPNAAGVGEESPSSKG